jgi:hypothetical protein
MAELLESKKADLIAVANAMLDGTMDLIEGVRKICSLVPAPIIWTRFCNSGRLSHGISLTGFEG